MKLLRVLSALFLLSMNAAPGFAADVTYSVQQTALHYTNTKITTTPKVSSESDATRTRLDTMPETLLLSAVADHFSFYFYPTITGSPVGLGYFLNHAIEVGANLKLASSKSDENETASKVIAPFINYYHEIGGLQFEGAGILIYSSEREETATTSGTGTPTTIKTEMVGYGMNAGAVILVPITKTFLYGAGLAVQLDNKEEKESETKYRVLTTTVHLAMLRANF